MKIPSVKIVCENCGRLLARCSPEDRRVRVRHWAKFERSASGEPRIVADCPTGKCRAHIVVKLSTIERRVAEGETTISV